jgi:hypothetical protein
MAIVGDFERFRVPTAPFKGEHVEFPGRRILLELQAMATPSHGDRIKKSLGSRRTLRRRESRKDGEANAREGQRRTAERRAESRLSDLREEQSGADDDSNLNKSEGDLAPSLAAARVMPIP